jgi:microcystin-dependent protein
MAAQSLTAVGGNQPHDNLQPFVCLNYIISLYGIFPQEN